MEQITLFQAIEEKAAEKYLGKRYVDEHGTVLIAKEFSRVGPGWMQMYYEQSGNSAFSIHINKIEKDLEEINHDE